MIRRTIHYSPTATTKIIRRRSIVSVCSIDANKPEQALTKNQKAAVQKALDYIFQEN